MKLINVKRGLVLRLFVLSLVVFYLILVFGADSRDLAISLPHVTTKLDASGAKTPRKGGILFLLNSFSGHYDTRVKLLHETWGRRVQESGYMHIIVVTNPAGLAPREGEDVRGTHCNEAYDGTPECCKRGEMFQIAWDYLQTEAGANIEWSAFIDDDIYILPDNLMRYLDDLGPQAKSEYKIYGMPMGSERCLGVWGGTGFVINRETLNLVIRGVSPGFQNVTEEILATCDYCHEFGDIAQTYVVTHKRHGLIKQSGDLHYDDRAHMYNMTYEEMETSLRRGPNELPWIFHHSTRGNMLWIHDKVREYGSNIP